MRLLVVLIFAALITSCGGGQSTDSVANVPLPFRLASPVSGDTETVLQLYQALYGKAPSFTQLNTFKSQIAANGAGVWVNATTASLNSLTNAAFATLVLNNISITPTSLTATALFGTSRQAYDGLLAGFVDYLNLVGVSNRGIVAAQLAKIISGLEVDTQFGVYGQAALSLNRQIGANSTYSSNPNNLTEATVLSAPTGLSATAASASQINLTWTVVTNATGYNVYRAATANVAITAANKITATPTAAVTYIDTTGLAAATKYYYKVTAVNLAGESGTASSEVTTTTGGVAAAGAPVLLAGANSTYSTNNFDNTGADARFAAAQGLVADTAGNVYVADVGNRSIRKITSAGVVTTFAGPDYAACGGALTLGTSCPVGDADGTGTTARFRTPNRIAIDATGNLYVGDQGRIRKITPAGVVSTLAGPDAASWAAAPTGNGLFGFTDGTGSAARFKNIDGLAADSQGNIFVTDYGNNTIRKVTPAGAVTTFVGPSNSTCAAAAFKDCPNGYVNGTGTSARFSSPYGTTIDAADNIYVVDGSRIRKISPAGVVTTFAGIDVGGPFLGSYVDATGTAARFSLLIGLAIDASGNLYVADGYGGTGNNLIRKVTPSGVVTTVLGVLNSTESYLKPNFATNKNYWIAANASSLYISQEGRIAIVNPKP